MDVKTSMKELIYLQKVCNIIIIIICFRFRSEDEFERFQQMDIERRRHEAALGSERKPRLIEESELPAFLLQVVVWKPVSSGLHKTFKLVNLFGKC